MLVESMPPYAYPLLIAAGFVAGFVNTLAGSGSLVTLPALIFLGLPPTVANGTNRLAILMQNMVAVSRFRDFGVLEVRKSGWLAVPAILGAILGARLAVDLDEELLRRTIGALFLLLLPVIALRPRRWLVGRQSDRVEHGWPVWVALFFIGVYGGFIQAGVGFILMAILHRVMGLDLVRVNMHKVFIVGVYTIVALAVFAARGSVLWSTGLVLAAGMALGGWIGSHVAVGKGEKLIRIVLNIALVAMAARLLLW